MRREAAPVVPIFRTSMQAELLARLYLQPQEPWTLASLARDLGVSSSTLHPEIRRLEDAELITADQLGRSRVLHANLDHPLSGPLTEIVEYVYGPRAVITEEFGRIPGISRLFIFGSWAGRHHGVEGHLPRDIDVLVVGNSDRRSGMNRRTRGEADIEQLLASGELQRVAGAGAAGGPWLAKAAATLHTAAGIVASDPNSAYTLAYDAARFACVGLLAQQGLRPTTSGGHYVVQRAMLRQFGAAFDPFAVMRRRRNELEYPEFPDETMEPHEAAEAIGNTKAMIESAAKLLDHLGLF